MDESEAGSVSDFARQPFAPFPRRPRIPNAVMIYQAAIDEGFPVADPPTDAARLRSPIRLPPHPADRLDALRLVRKSALDLLAGESARRKRLPHNVGQTLSSVNPAIPVSVPQNGCKHPLPMGYNP